MIYERIEGEYTYNSKGIVTKTKSIWMIASTIEKDRWVLLSHGSEENIKNKYSLMSKAYIDAGFYQEIKDLYLLNASDFSIDDINKCIENAGYISNLINADIFWKKEKKKI